jgi:choline dehydrogenase-like flavoprotein
MSGRQAKTSERSEYDAVVIGSGAGGGMAAYVLTQRGLHVLLLEAGRHYDPRTETPMFQVQADAPLNGASTPDKEEGYYDATIGGSNIAGEPYTLAPGSRFYWWRARMLGGRTNHWGRISLRYGPHDFRTYTRDGIGFDWPISYEDIAPYYDRVEKLIGVFGAAEGLENSPDSPPGILLPPPPLRGYELWTQMVLQKRFGIQAVPSHAAILTQPHNGRPACLYATPCDRGCSIAANFQSPTVLLAPALATGRLEVRIGAMVYEVAVDQRGSATGVHYIDKSTGARHFAGGRTVVLAASSCETARILLNSKSAGFPNGLANSSGEIGRNLTNTPAAGVSGQIPALQGLPPVNEDGVWTMHALVPWQGYRDRAAGRLKFATEYQVFLDGGRTMPAVADFSNLAQKHGKPLYGQALRSQLRRDYGSSITLLANGSMVPNRDCYCEIDPAAKDRWGVPVLRFHWKMGTHERELAKHAVSHLSDVISAMGGEPDVIKWADGDILNTDGYGYHELGTARMGMHAANSVLTANGHAWDVRNLYVTDGASFASHAAKNPTQTILALAWRASDHLADSLMHKEI